MRLNGQHKISQYTRNNVQIHRWLYTNSQYQHYILETELLYRAILIIKNISLLTFSFLCVFAHKQENVNNYIILSEQRRLKT